jgi:hypothetical protein
MNIQETPFKVKTRVTYPSQNKIIFEEYFYDWFIRNNPETKKTYLPIFWTNYYHAEGTGMGEINSFLNTLDKNRQYFTIIQWDDGIMSSFPYENITVFGQGGGSGKPNCKIGDYSIPLNCLPNPNLQIKKEKTIFASFKGAIVGRHLIREKMLNSLRGKKDYLLQDIAGESNYESFSDIMSSSTFSLCPRGYGATSFRICEALQHQSIPVYITDKLWLPFNDLINFNDYGVLIEEKDIGNIDRILKSLSQEEIDNKINFGKTVYEQYYSFEGCASKIIQITNR